MTAIKSIRRKLYSLVAARMFKGKAIILIGPRQVGKSTLFRMLDEENGLNALMLNCDDPDVRLMLTSLSTAKMRLLVADYKTVIIDEAQRVDSIGLTIKRLVENFPDVQILVTGSSSLDLQSAINEPLTGRKYEYFMYPVSTGELLDTGGLSCVSDLFIPRLIYGSYPEILTHPDEALELLTGLAGSYLYKDILEMDGVRRPVILDKLLVALALQVGSEVSYSEVAQTVGSDPRTVEKYIDLLEKCFVVRRLGALSRNLRNEPKKSKKIYFYDTGIRNAIIKNFAEPGLRTDMGALWENFFIMERIKRNAYLGISPNYYFWRTTSQQEIDFIEEIDGKMNLFELKWNPRTSSKFPESFLRSYSVRMSAVVNPENYIDYLLPSE